MREAVHASVRSPYPRSVCDLDDLHHLADTDPARHSNPAPEAPFTTPEGYPQMHGGLE